MKIKRNIIVSFVSLFLLSACSGDKWIGTDDENAIQFQAWVGSGMIDGNLTRTTGENYVALPVGYTLSMTMKTSSENIKTLVVGLIFLFSSRNFNALIKYS